MFFSFFFCCFLRRTLRAKSRAVRSKRKRKSSFLFDPVWKVFPDDTPRAVSKQERGNEKDFGRRRGTTVRKRGRVMREKKVMRKFKKKERKKEKRQIKQK